MDHDRRVQVVLGEAERTDGLLRFILEAEGFDIIGLASDDEELARVLRGARPAVVVLDGGISAAAALEARQRVAGAALVVVWPDGVSAVIAEERVDPDEVIEDLGDAVRRAVRHADRRVEREQPDELIRVPDVPDVAPAFVRDPAILDDLPTPYVQRARGAQLLVAVATWVLILTAFTTIAIAVPNALGLFSGRGGGGGGGRPTLAGPVSRLANDPRREPSSAPGDDRDTDGRETCERPGATGDRSTDSQVDTPADPEAARGCPTAESQQEQQGTGKGGDGPNDFGSGSNGDGSSTQAGGGGSGEDGQGADGQGADGQGTDEQGNPGQGDPGQGDPGQGTDEQGTSGQGDAATGTEKQGVMV